MEEGEENVENGRQKRGLGQRTKSRENREQ